MTWEQIISLIKKYRILISICALLLAVLAWDIATTENGVYIQTTQTEDDFVIVCKWHSDVEQLHGGASRLKTRVLVGKSNTDLDCGWWLYGNLSVTVRHPIYRYMSGCDRPVSCTASGFLHKDGKMIFTPRPFDQFLKSLPKTMTGGELYDRVKAAMGGMFDLYYFKKYVEARPPDMVRFKTLYHEHLKGYWQIRNSIIDSKNDSINPTEAMERYWIRVGEFLEEYY
jgi:hypothetical protein